VKYSPHNCLAIQQTVDEEFFSHVACIHVTAGDKETSAIPYIDTTATATG